MGWRVSCRFGAVVVCSELLWGSMGFAGGRMVGVRMGGVQKALRRLVGLTIVVVLVQAMSCRSCH
jgi:hypothetical protein